MSITRDDAEKVLKSVFPPWVMELNLELLDLNSAAIRLLLPPNPKIERVGGLVAGQASLALADTAMVMALVNSIGEFRPVGTINLNASFMRPMANTGIICEASVARLGKTTAFCRATLQESKGAGIAIEVAGTYSVPAVMP